MSRDSTASRSPVLTRGGICVPPTVTYLPYRVSGSTLTAVGRSHLLARWPGTLSRILPGIQRAAQTVLGVYLKRTCSRVTSALIIIGILSPTHSLTLGLNPSFSANPPYPAFSFSPSGFTMWISQTVYCYFLAYPSFYFLVFLFLHIFSCRFRAVD